MATQAQVDANQANSQKSTGPTTEEGKARSARSRHADRADSGRSNGPPSLDQPARHPLHSLSDRRRTVHNAHTELLKVRKQRRNSKIGFESKKPEVAPGSTTDTAAANAFSSRARTP